MQITRVKHYKKIGVKNTLDFEVNHPDHNFYCEGLVVSNSHAVSYATLSAASTYVKFKYPQEFFIECLNAAEKKGDSREEISLINQELSYFGIKILPPDLSKSQLEFTKEKSDIRYGLKSIKGISDKSVGGLKDFVSKERENKFQVFKAAKECGLNIGIVSALIQAGTLDSHIKDGDSRASMVYEAQLFGLLTPREKDYALQHGKEYGYSVFKIVKDMLNWKTPEGKQMIRSSRIETLSKAADPYREIFKQNSSFPEFANYVYEKELLGYSYSTSLREVCKNSHSGDLSSAKEVLEGNEPFYHICGEIRETKYQKAKSGKQYLRIDVEDDTGVATCMMFEPDVFSFVKTSVYPKLMSGARVIISGKKWNDCIIIGNARLLDEKIYLKLADLKG